MIRHGALHAIDDPLSTSQLSDSASPTLHELKYHLLMPTYYAESVALWRDASTTLHVALFREGLLEKSASTQAQLTIRFTSSLLAVMLMSYRVHRFNFPLHDLESRQLTLAHPWQNSCR